MSQTDLILFFIMLGVGLVVGIVDLIVMKAIKGKCSVKVVADTTQVERVRYYNGKMHDVPTFEYDFGGQHYSTNARTFLWRFRVGKKETLIINPEDPTKHYRHADLSACYFLLVWSLGVTATAVFNFIKYLFMYLF